MLVAVIANNAVARLANYREFFGSEPAPTDADLAAKSLMRVNAFRPHDQLTQTLVPCDPVIEGDWVYTVAVRDLTAEEIEQAKNSAMANIRAQRNQLLTNTDGTQAVDNPSPKKADWAAYRQALRDLPVTIAASGTDPRIFNDWPKDPNWKPMTI